MSFQTSITLPDSAPTGSASKSHPCPFPRVQRVTRGADIEQVRKEGKRVRTASLDVRTIASLHALARVGVVVPRYGHSAVDRNRLKRRLRELIRVELLP
ncbi:MAG: ribonuclease P protein component, partial [Gemmatimonadota bacterium]|nr:ribonuclease P protein component [Gemmatimonadota bacterium]